MAKPSSWAERIEQDGENLAKRIIGYIERNGGQWLRDNSGSFHVILKGKRIPINHKQDNVALSGLFIDACNVSTVGPVARIAIQRLNVHAHGKADRLEIRKFSAMSQDGKRLYMTLDVDDGSILVVTSEELFLTDNGNNEDGFWLEHPGPGSSFKWSETKPKIGLFHFQRLLVRTLACEEPLQWLIAMHEGIFPFVRDLCSARFLIVHIGDSQSGKTTGAQRFTLLHGLGDVKGDYTVAAYGNVGDIGLLVMDNKEQKELSQDYINFLLFLATGAERGRSYKDGRMRPTQSGRPVGVITSIEGVTIKTELRKRCVDVPFAVKGDKLSRGSIERTIVSLRNLINSAIAEVLKQFFLIRASATRLTPKPLPDFDDHFDVLCDLLRAYAVVACKPDGWAEDIIEEWNKFLTEREPEEDALEHPLLRVLREHGANDPDFKTVTVTYGGRAGTLHVTDCGALLTKLQEVISPLGNAVPFTTGALGRRLRSTRFRAFQVLDENNASEVAMLKRTPKRRPIGFFFEDDGNDGSVKGVSLNLSLAK